MRAEIFLEGEACDCLRVPTALSFAAITEQVRAGLENAVEVNGHQVGALCVRVVFYEEAEILDAADALAYIAGLKATQAKD
jgi:hypothetical protein